MKNMRLTNAQMGWGTYNSARKGSGKEYHNALDVYGDNSDILAMANGTIKYCSNSNNGGGANGRYIVIEHNIGGRICYSFYAHLASVIVSNGDTVSAGQKIGVMGGSGSGSDTKYGKHLHFAIVDVLKEGKSYFGYLPYFDKNNNSTYYSGVTYYNPWYVLNNGRLP